MVKLSIIVPVYNAEAYLDSCLTSLVEQEYKDKEIILVNDGSKDSSLDICNKYAINYPYIRVIDKENEGASSARNIGIDSSQAAFISFVDADDCVDKDHFSILMNHILKHNCDVAAVGYKTEYAPVFKNKNQVKSHYIYEGSKHCLAGISNDVNSLTGYVWNKVYKKNTIQGLRFRNDVSICEDLIFNYEFMKNVSRACYIDVETYHYRYVPNSLSKTTSIEKYLSCLNALEFLCDWCKINAPHCIEDTYKNYIFWITKVCESMLYCYDENVFIDIQKKLECSKGYISICKLRIRILASQILKSWEAYKCWGIFFFRAKVFYRQGKTMLYKLEFGKCRITPVC